MSETKAAPQAVVVIERTYKASVEELWALWATKEGFESWWGPEGFRVEVSTLEPHEGGALVYEMIADAPDAIAAMREMGRPLSHATRGTYTEFKPHRRLQLTHLIDFVPKSDPYETLIDVDFSQVGDGARMIVTLHPHLDPEWTRNSAIGFASSLTKLDRRYGWTGA
jgi:uncharacterized protein YndB with AHSA1/START domain